MRRVLDMMYELEVLELIFNGTVLQMIGALYESEQAVMPQSGQPCFGACFASMGGFS